jgi:hypothetical protein
MTLRRKTMPRGNKTKKGKVCKRDRDCERQNQEETGHTIFA